MMRVPLILLQNIVPYCDAVAAQTLVNAARSRFHEDHVFQLQKTWLIVNSVIVSPMLTRNDYLTLFAFATSIRYPVRWTVSGDESVSYRVSRLFHTHPHIFHLLSSFRSELQPWSLEPTLTPFSRIAPLYDWQSALFAFSHVTNFADVYHINLHQQKVKYGDEIWDRPWTQQQSRYHHRWQSWLQAKTQYYQTEHFLIRSRLVRARFNYIIGIIEEGTFLDKTLNEKEEPKPSIADLETTFQDREKQLDQFETFIWLCPTLYISLHIL